MMNRLSSQILFFAPAAVMSAWATVMLHTFASGHINRLLSPMFRSYVMVAAILLGVLSVLYLLLYQAGSQSVPVTGRWRQMGRWLVLLIPVVAASVLSPSALSSTTMDNRTLSSTAGAYAMPTLNTAPPPELTADPNQPVPVEVTDLIAISNKPDEIQKFEGRKVTTVGLFAPPGGSSAKLVRWIMWCCAADAQPASVEITGNTAGAWKENDWLEVVGTAHFPSTLGHVVPQIDVESIKPTQEPDEPFLSP